MTSPYQGGMDLDAMDIDHVDDPSDASQIGQPMKARGLPGSVYVPWEGALPPLIKVPERAHEVDQNLQLKAGDELNLSIDLPAKLTGTTTVDGGLGGDEIRFKGELPALEVWVGTEAGLRPLRSGERVSEGTRVNLVFDARGHRLATLAGQDGTGSVEIYDTLDVAGQTGLIEAPFALELDDAPGPQAFFLLVHDEPLAADIIQDHVRDGTGELTRVVLDKE